MSGHLSRLITEHRKSAKLAHERLFTKNVKQTGARVERIYDRDKKLAYFSFMNDEDVLQRK